MKSIKISLLTLSAIAVCALVFFACTKSATDSPSVTSAAAPARKTKMDAPAITCGTSTQVSINIQVTAGATGAPAGFSLQWLTKAAFELGPDNHRGRQMIIHGRLLTDLALCKASFSGNANLSRYNLAPNASVTVNIGEFLFDEGASTNCGGALVCGTDYVFRAFAHANSTLQRSDFTANLTCKTLDCDSDEGGCTYTQGYWKTHGPTGCNPSSGANTWTVSSLMLGTVTYTDVELCSIFNTPAAGNGLIALAHQLIAAKLNIANGADGTDAAASIAAADALIGGLVIPPVGAGSLAPAATSALITALTNYNEGATGPGHCD
jgi:hypothetical protein